MKIQKIEIHNVKGIEHLEINQDVFPNRPNIFVAPNGFGKTSIATAFKSLKPTKIELQPEDFYSEDSTKNPSIVITQSDGTVLCADKDKNEISSNFAVYVVNSQLKPKATVQKWGNFATGSASLDIEPTILVKKIPQNVPFKYSHSEEKRLFGCNGKILMNISTIYGNLDYIKIVEKDVDFGSFTGKRFQAAIDGIKSWINLQKGTSESIKQLAERDETLVINHSDFNQLKDNIKNVLSLESDVDASLCALQYLNVRLSMRGDFKKAVSFLNYKTKRDLIDKTLEEINPVKARFPIHTSINGNSLVVKWPKANQISSGQRDIMVFVAKLLECSFCESGNCIVIIDEFFDYLDDANVVVFQYYISTLIERYKQEKRLIIPILLTHLDPSYLKHFCFDDKRLNVCYLKDSQAKIGKMLKALVDNRENDLIKQDVDSYYLHFHPNIEAVDITENFQSLGINKDWGKTSVFIKKIHREGRKYWYEDLPDYDSLAVCLSIRIRIEEIVFYKIDDEDRRIKFINTHTTREKLQYARSIGVTVPETYFLLGIIYNHPLHEIDENTAKSLSLKLENLQIKEMIQSLWR